MKITRLGSAALMLGAFAGALPAHAEGIIPPFKVHFSVRFNISSTAHPQPTAPWWAYFPQDAHTMAAASGTVYPHWPTNYPPAAQPTSTPRPPAAGPNAAGPNMVHSFGSTPVYHPASYSRDVSTHGVPSYWYSR